MKCFLILLAASLTASEKLDRTYLPPPGAQFAGGNPGDILAPLETPKLPQTGLIPVNSIPNKFNEFEPTGQPIQLPVTTTSYAFSQTTTFPIESFETTTGPLNPITGLPIQNVGPFSNLQHYQPGAFNQKQGEILIGGSFPNQPMADQSISKIGSVKYPGGQRGNENFSQYSGTDGVNADPTFQTIEAVAQAQAINQYPENSLNPQEPSVVSGQANIIPNHQHGNLQNQGRSPEYILPDNPDRHMSLDIMQPYLNQDNQNENRLFSSNTAVQHSPSKNQNTFNLGSILEKNNYQPGQAHDEVLSTTLSSSSVSKIPLGSHINRPPRPQAAGDRSAVILKYDNSRTPNGYSYSFETSNGIRADENGTVGDGTKAQGSYSYTGDDGKVYSVFYTADENGFQPRGDHLPTSPPIPDAIREVIEQAARDEAAGIFDDGSYDENKYGYKDHYLSENQRLKHRNKLERNKIQPASNKNESQQFDESSNTKDTNILGENHPTSKIRGNNGNEEIINSEKSVLRGSYFSEPSKNEENSSYLKNGDSVGPLTDLKTYMLPVSEEYTGQQDIQDSRDHYPIETHSVEGIMQSKSHYPGSVTSSTNKKIDYSDNGENLSSVYDNGIISQNEQPEPGQPSPYPSPTFSEISNRRQNKYQTPINNKQSGILNNKYINENTPQAGQAFNRINIKDFESKRIDNPSFTDYSQNSNNQQSTNQEIIPQLNETGYYYNLPTHLFDHTEFPTRFKGEEVSSTTKSVNETPTRKPFLTPEVHYQPLIRKEYRDDFSTTPQPFMTSQVITQKDDYNSDYENDKDYIFDEDIDNKDVSTTTQPGDIDSSTRYSNQSSETVTPSYKKTSSFLTPSPPSRFSSTENPSENRKSQQLQRPNPDPPITSNNRNFQVLNNKSQTARPAHNFDKTNTPHYSSNVVKPGFTNHIPTEFEKSDGSLPTGITSSPNTPEYQTGLETSSPGKPDAHQFSPITSIYQNQPIKSDYNPRPQIPERFDFESIPGYYQNINKQRPIDYSVTKKTPSKLDKPGIFILSESGPTVPESLPIGGTQEFTTPDIANTILSSTPSNFLPSINTNSPGSQILQTLPPSYQYRPPKPLFSTTTSPSTVATTPNFFIPSTQPSLLPEVYSTTPQHPSYFSPPDIFHQNPIVDGFGKPIIPELRSVFSTPGQNASPNAGIHYSDTKYFEKPEESSVGSLPSDDERRPTYAIKQSSTYPGYNNPTRVIGEDFSGPKQPQRYDAQTGYHYK